MVREVDSDVFDRIDYDNKRDYLHKRKVNPDRLRVTGIDTETTDSGKCFMICTPDDVILPEQWPDVLFEKYPGAKFVCFNIKFDAGSFLQHLPKRKLEELRVMGFCEHEEIKYEYFEGKQLRMTCGKVKVTFWDIFQYYNSSLNVAAKKYLGEEKIDIETKTFTEEYINEHFDEIAEYCKKDAYLTQRLAELIIDTLIDWKIPCTSLISTAYVSEVHFTLKCKPYTLGSDFEKLKEPLKFAFNAYSGGIFQCWKRGKGYFYIYDINSAYPNIIKELIDLRGAKFINAPEYRENADYGWYLCDVNIEDDVYHTLAVRNSGINYYPIGRFTKYMIKPEYEYLVRNNIRVKILDAWHCYVKDREKKPFYKEIMRLYEYKEELKRKGDKGMQYMMTKILMNSFYGKFMQLVPYLPEDVVKMILDGKIDIEKVSRHSYRYKAGALWNPFYSSYITGLVRLQVVEIANKHKDCVCAVATDSLISTKPLELDFGEGLGQWTKESEGEGIIIGSGVYQVGNKSKFRGFDTKIELLELIRNYPDKSTNVIKIDYVRPYTWKEVVFRGLELDQINQFHNEEKELDINFEIRRVWERDWIDIEDMLSSGIMNSYPLFEFSLYKKEEQIQERIQKKLEAEYRKEFRRLILSEGGVNDKDYEYLPKWCIRRKTGRGLDEFVIKLQEAGYPAGSANEVYELLWKYS
ncbi:MAG: DNA polymerase [Candidatus Jordarchaeaceae archaeon]